VIETEEVPVIATILTVNNPSGWEQGRGWVFVRASAPYCSTPYDCIDGTTRDPSYEIHDVSRVGDGWRVCMSGRHGTSCGRVFDLGFSYTELGYTYRYLARADYCSEGGDSGGPVYAYHHAYGIHQGGIDGCSAVFQSVVQAQDGLNVDVMLSP
jgi:hypothetical protein